MRNRLFHLVAGEAARDEDTVEKFVRINFPRAGKPRKRVDVEPVAPVHHGYGISVSHRVRRHLKRQLKDRAFTVEQKHLAWLFCKCANDAVRTGCRSIIMYF